MPPKTRMNESQVRLNNQRRRHEWENRTGIELVTDETYQGLKEQVGPLASILPKVRNNWRYFRRG